MPTTTRTAMRITMRPVRPPMRRALLTMLLSALLLGLTGCGAPQPQTQEGMQAVAELRYEDALTLFERALVGGEDPELVYRGQGIACMGLTRYDEAAEAFERALACADRAGDLEYDINYYLAAAYARAGRADDAIGVYSAILRLRPQEKYAWLYRGTLLLGQGRTAEAEADFSQAIAIAPKEYDLYREIAQRLSEAGCQSEAEDCLRQALAVEDKSRSDLDTGRLYYELGDYQSARECLERAGEKGGAQGALYLGKTYEALGDYNYAASVYAGFLNGDPAQPQLQNQLGLCCLRMGSYEQALEAFEAGLALEDNEDLLQTLKFNEIVAHEYLGDFDRAASLMQEYLRSYPDDGTAQREYRFLKTR